MRILLLTNYYTPDFGAGSFRMQALVDAFARINKSDLKVDVYTTFPNRYGSRFENLKEFEDYGWLTVNRVKLPKHNAPTSGVASGRARIHKKRTVKGKTIFSSLLTLRS